jgi:heat shock protein HtpX
MYNEIAANKRKTWFLIFLVSAIIIVFSVVIGALYDLDIYSSIILGTLFSSGYSLISYYFSDKIALATNGAKEIKKADAPELYNLVENLCIANGQPVPRIYVIDDPSPNAFATGRDPKHSSIAFTTGIVALLDKQELEGVTAHELSHVKNYDIRVMTIVVVLVGSIMLMSNILLRGRFFGGRNEKNNAVAILAILGLVLAILSPLFAELIKLAVSRSREYLADASGALLTRYPEGLASALEKISAVNQPMKSANQATAHLFIQNPFGQNGKARSFLGNLFSTHPPAEERIKRLRSMGR